MRRRTEAPERRRGDLLDAALQIVLDKGVAGLTVDEVTARAEVAKGTFYLYFRSKEQLLGALQDRFVDELTARQQAELGRFPAGDWMGRLLHWMESGIRGYLAHADLHDALFHHPRSAGHGQAARHGHEADPAINQHAAALAGLLEAGTAAGAFALADHRAAAILLYNTMHGTADYLVERAGHHGTTGSAADLVDSVIAESLNLCRRYVEPAGSAS
ncbi:DNA-binding transcriptional regulator, AcrR family [Amycolatopsis tolypomycina]|uniref:DNA-binding transcriptional regulator, AcrR family n=1 Tax=Amycolatopsis tolypomycina TaxID=208445 RepID=A0A1H5CJS0_9PSEU|nr:TetR/AcrR family transcriptional regulator [Amycolatopsis tolypomycina]SED66865.1 DNA-binding transcriptional regulator, AcrR family [Amycolatopsis tolypomycina]